MSDIMSDISENICTPNLLGEVLGFGSNSICIKPKEFIIETNYVLIITNEEKKFSLLELLFKDSSSAKVEKLNKKILNEKYLEIFNQIEEEEFYFFLMSEGKNIDIEDSFSDTLLKVSNDFFWETFQSGKSFNAKIIKDSFNNQLKLSKEKGKSSNNEIKLLDSLFYSLDIIKSMDISLDIQIDLSEKQFLDINGEIFCVDPIIYI